VPIYDEEKNSMRNSSKNRQNDKKTFDSRFGEKQRNRLISKDKKTKTITIQDGCDVDLEENKLSDDDASG